MLVGPGPSETEELIDWDGPDVAALLADRVETVSPLGRRLSTTDAAIAWSRGHDLARALARRVPRVLFHDPSPREGVPASVWLAEPVRALGADPTPLPPDLEPTPGEEAAAAPWLARLPRGFLAVHPGSGSPAKNWPAERFRGLADLVSRDRPWLLVEGPADGEAAAPLRRHRGAVGARGLPPRVLGALLGRAGLYVGNDSGVSHLAAAFGAPTLALFGPTDPATWAPVGRAVIALRSPDGETAGLALEGAAEAAARLTSPARAC